MKKSVYSLVLMDDVVEAIDRMAYARNTSRSNLINQILAEHVSYVTPQMRMRDIFSCLEQILSEECYQIQSQASESMFSIRSPIRYKYRPTVRYSIELYQKPEELAGELRVSVRSSSQSFLEAIGIFFRWWIQMEEQYLQQIYPEGVPCGYEDGKYRRGFSRLGEETRARQDRSVSLGDVWPGGIQPEGIRPEDIRSGVRQAAEEEKANQNEKVVGMANAIGGYIKVLDRCLKTYFEHQGEPDLAEEISGYYESYLGSGLDLI